MSILSALDGGGSEGDGGSEGVREEVVGGVEDVRGGRKEDKEQNSSISLSSSVTSSNGEYCLTDLPMC